MERARIAIVVALVLSVAGVAARGDDWNQWRGPKRDGVWRESGLLDAIPAGGLKVVWRAPVGMGYAGPAVAGGKVFVMDRSLRPGASNPADPFSQVKQGIPGTERIACFDAATGKALWAHEYDCPYTVSYAGGPRATPAVDGDRVYAYGAEGHLHCLDANTGRVVWGRKLTDHPTPVWGYASHPLVEGDLVYVTVADPEGILWALNKHTGERAWRAVAAKEAGYSPPVVHDVAGRRQLIQWYPSGVTSLDPATGATLWTVAQEPMQYGGTAVTPVVHRDAELGDVMFVASQYGGTLLLKLGKDGRGEPNAAIVKWEDSKPDRTSRSVKMLMVTPVVRDGHVYGLTVRGQLACIELATGKVKWESPDVTTYDDEERAQWATAFITPLGEQGGRTLFANDRGDLLLGDMTPQGLTVRGKAHLLEPTNRDARRPVVWVHPAYAGRRVFWRNDKELACFSFADE